MAVKCFLDKNLDSEDCDFGISGLTDILLAKKTDVAGFAYGVNGMVTGITMKPGKFFYRVPSKYGAGYNLERASAGFSPTIKVALSFTVPGMDAEKKAQLEGLLVGTPTIALMQRADGTWVITDKGYVKQVDGPIGGSGVAENDESGTTLQMEGNNKGLPSIVDPDIVEALVYVEP